MTGESTLDRHRRILAVATGSGTVIFALLAAGALSEQAGSVLPWVYLPLAALFCGLPILLIPLGLWAPIRWIITTSRIHTVVAVVLILTWVPAMTSSGLPGDRAPWVLNTLAVAAATSVIAWSAAATWIYIAVLATLGGILRFAVLGNGDLAIPFQDFLSMFGFGFIIATILIVTLRAGHAQDLAVAQALEDARAAAEADSRARQRARFGSLVHDEVITTLLAAAHSTGRAPAVEESAARALVKLDQFVDDHTAAAAFTPDALAVQLRSAASEFATGIRFSGDLQAFAGTIPAPVALALTGALAEAVRNSVGHQGARSGAVTRTTALAATSSSVSVVLTDDGPGFDPRRVAPERLGIRSSIVGRMVGVGGEATVTSSPGKGTTVQLRWVAG